MQDSTWLESMPLAQKEKRINWSDKIAGMSAIEMIRRMMRDNLGILTSAK